VTKLASYIAHNRLQGHSGINPIDRIVVGATHNYVLYRTWSPDVRGPNDLQAFLQVHGKLPESQCRQYFRQVATLVADAHKNNIILRDVKLRKFIFKTQAR
jgi:tribbles-like protein